MVHIKTLAPTILDALTAVEQGCRKVENDPLFVPELTQWMIISKGICYGCIATCTLMQLVNKSPKDIIDSFIPDPLDPYKSPVERAGAYGLQPGTENVVNFDFKDFELAIDNLRSGQIRPLLKFYELDTHPKADEVMAWLFNYQSITLDNYPTKEELIEYADFLRSELIPQLKSLLELN
jgi:hypothetical protein